MSVLAASLAPMYNAHTRIAALVQLDEGRSLSEVSRETGIHRSTLRWWRDGPTRGAECPVCEAAPLPCGPYAALLGYYLGDGCLSRHARYHSLRVSCDAGFPAIVLQVSGAMQAVRPHGRVFHVRAPGTVVVQGHWKHWTCLFPQHGPGRKHERPIALEPWQRTIVEEHPGAFLRGLFHSDGCRTRNWTRKVIGGELKRYDYPRWQFTNHSADIRELCCWALDLVDIPWRQSNWKTISVSRREAVSTLDALIGLKR